MIESLTFSIGDMIEPAVEWLNINFHQLFAIIGWLSEGAISGIVHLLMLPPPPVLILLVGLLAFFVSGWKSAVMSCLGLAFCLVFDLWEATLQTSTVVVIAVVVSLAIGVPTGVIASQNARAQSIARPILDIMQTMPPWVYLVPAVIFFSLGPVPALMATIVYGIPPVVRITILGMQQVPLERIELGRALGASKWGILTKIELPSARPTLLVAVNQCIMLSLAMVVLAGLVGAGGLGAEVTRGLTRMELGLGLRSGLAIVVLALIMDNLSRGALTKSNRGRHWPSSAN